MNVRQESIFVEQVVAREIADTMLPRFVGIASDVDAVTEILVPVLRIIHIDVDI
jgi:hypothetical protein